MQAKIIKNTLLFSVFVLLAQIIGLVRDLYLARFFGIGQALDVYYLAFKVPDFLNVFYSVFLGSVVFIPLLTKAYYEGGDKEILKKINTLGSLVLTFIISFGVILFIFMGNISAILAPNFTNLQLLEMTHISRILIFSQLFFPIGILGGALGMVKGKAFPMAISGFIYNIVIFMSTLAFFKYLGIYATVYGVVVGAICFAIVQTFGLEIRTILKEFRFQINLQEWQKFLTKNFGRFVAVLIYQLFAILLLYFAGLTGEAGVSTFSIAYNLFLALFFIVGSSLGTALMPQISQLHLQNMVSEQKSQLNNSLIYISHISIITTIFVLIFKLDIVKLLYYFSYIGFDKEIYISSIFAMLMLSFVAYNSLEIIRKYLYSTNQISLAALLTVFLIIFISSINFYFLKFVGFVSLYDLSLSFFVSTFFSLILIIMILQKKGQLHILEILNSTYKVLFASIIIYVTFVNLFSLGIFAIFDSYNFIFVAITKGIVILIFYIIFIYIFNDKIGKNILKTCKLFK